MQGTCSQGASILVGASQMINMDKIKPNNKCHGGKLSREMNDRSVERPEKVL